jgi:hypothetical protein
MSTKLQPVELPTFFSSLDRRLDERGPVGADEIDEPRRDVELMLAELDKRLVLLGFGEGDLDTPMGQRVGARLAELDDEQWSKPVAEFEPDTTLLEHVRSVVEDAAAALRR